MTRVRVEPYPVQAASLGPENPLPAFRKAESDLKVPVADSVPPEDRERLGWAASFRVLPYRMQDAYAAETEPASLPSIVVENAHLRAVFLPGLGARLISLEDLATGRELLDRNPALRLANVALRNAWFSGGIEWNLPHLGHHPLTCAPVFASRITGPDGTPGVRFHEFERMKRLLWQLDVHLPEDSRFLLVSIRIVNLNAREIPMYWWTNLAVPETPETRTLVPADDMLAGDPHGALARLPLPRPDGPDDTYPARAPRATEMFFRVAPGERPWIAALDGTGRGIAQASTARLGGRKMFAWGAGETGRRWQARLSRPGRAYFEIQAGLARTQSHSVPMPGEVAWSWTEAFGLLETDPALTHGTDWTAARREASRALEAALPSASLDAWHARAAARFDEPPGESLHRGSGWGALERMRMESAGERMPAGLTFPDATLGPEQEPWLALLREGVFPPGDTLMDPGAWMVQAEWERLLDKSLESPTARHWRTWLHLGVIRMERLEPEGARAAFENSLALAPSAWALRNLAQLKLRDGWPAEAAELMERAWSLRPAGHAPALALAREALEAFLAAERYAHALWFTRSLPDDLKAHGRIQYLYAAAAVRGGEPAEALEILSHELWDIREGEAGAVALWEELHERLLAAREGVPRDAALRERVRREFPPPAHLRA